METKLYHKKFKNSSDFGINKINEINKSKKLRTELYLCGCMCEMRWVMGSMGCEKWSSMRWGSGYERDGVRSGVWWWWQLWDSMEMVVMQFDGIEMRDEGEMWVEQMKVV